MNYDWEALAARCEHAQGAEAESVGEAIIGAAGLSPYQGVWRDPATGCLLSGNPATSTGALRSLMQHRLARLGRVNVFRKASSGARHGALIGLTSAHAAIESEGRSDKTEELALCAAYCRIESHIAAGGELYAAAAGCVQQKPRL